MKQRTLLSFLVAAAGWAIASAGTFAVHAQASQADHESHHVQSTATAPVVEGEVRKIDREQAKITLRHGPIDNLEMPAMTMVFKASDRKMLEGLKEGDKVRFSAARIDGAITVTAIEPAAK